MSMLRPLTSEEREEFDRNGVVCLRGVVALHLVDLLRDAIDESVRTFRSSPAGYDLTRICDAIHARDLDTLAKDSGGQYNVLGLAAAILQSNSKLLVDNTIGDTTQRGRFVLDTGIASRIAGFRHFTLHGPGPEIAAELMKSSSVRFYDDQIFVKEPGTRERTAYHQDGSYFHLDGDQICTQWIPVDVVPSDVSLKYVRGSHRWGKTYRPNVFIAQMDFPGSVGDKLPDIEGNEAQYDLISFDVAPGDIVVHHHRTIHGAPGNPHNAMRRAAGVRYCGDDVRFRQRPAAPVLAHHTHNLNDGDPLDCAQFPVVWPPATREQAA